MRPHDSRHRWSDAAYAAEAVKVSKIYGEGDAVVRALDSVSVGFPKGRFTVIMGPSGSGKSTLMHCLAGLDSVTSGNVCGYILTLHDFGGNATNDLDYLVLANRANGVSDATARTAVDPIVAEYPGVSLQDQTEFKKQVAGQIDQLLAMVFVLLLLAVIIAVLGAVLSLGVGAFFGWAAVSALGDIGVDRLSFPAARLVSCVVFAMVAGTLAAVFPARRATRLNVLEAIAHQ